MDGEGDGGDGEGRVCGCITLIAGRGLSGERRVTKAGGWKEEGGGRHGSNEDRAGSREPARRKKRE